MTTTLIVPDYILAQREAKKKAEEAAKQKTLKERSPQPTGWRLLVMPYMGREKTEGGVYVPDQAREREARATVVAYVLKVGPLAYKDADKFGEAGPWCSEGDWVCIGRYAGSRFQIEGGEVRIINDDEVIATIVDPDDIKTYGA
jgi:chaperonin GroES